MALEEDERMKEAQQFYKSVNRNFFTQASDEAYALRLVDYNSLRFLFTLNCLFFDFISIGAAALLGNPVLYRMLRDEKDAMSLLYRSSSASGYGVLQPVIMGDHETMAQVAESMIKANTIYQLSNRTELENHAQLIDDAGTEYLWCPELDFRLNYYENMLEISKYLNMDGLQAWSDSEQLFPVGSLSTFVDWLISVAPKDDLRCSSIYRFVDKSLPVRLRHRVKLLAETIYQYTLSLTQMAALSTSGEVAPLIHCIRALSTLTGGAEALEPQQRRLEFEDVRISLPLEGIAKLPLRHLIVVRDLSAFREARSVLADFRWGRKSTSATKVQRALDKCTDQLLEYVSRTDLQRTVFVEDLRKREKITRLKIWYDVSATAIPLMLSFLFPGGTPKILAVIASGTLLGFSRHIKRGEAGPNTIHPEVTGKRTVYSPARGSLESERRKY
jgi:hypothetical protein